MRLSLSQVREAVLDVQESVEYEIATEQMRAVIDAVPELLYNLAELNGVITWDTTCGNCAKLMDKSYSDYIELDKSKQTLAKIRSLPLVEATDAESIGFNAALTAVRACIDGPEASENLLKILGGQASDQHL